MSKITYSYEKRMEFIEHLKHLLMRSDEAMKEGNMEGCLYYINAIERLRQKYGYTNRD